MKYKSGFTLIEVMITVAIIGIISAFAYPSYQEYVVRSKRADGMSALLQLQQAMERYKVANYDYNISSVTDVFTDQVPVDGGKPYYTLSAESTNGGIGYLLTAKPTGSMAGKKDLTLTHTGARTWGTKSCWPQGADCP